MIKVAIVEDKRDIREGWQLILEAADGFECVATYVNGESAVEGLPIVQPDVVLMDIGLPKMSGIDCVKILKDIAPEIDIIMLTIQADETSIFESLRAGAVGYLVKNIFPSKLLNSIKEVKNGGSPMSSVIARKVVSSFNSFRKPAANLTKREQEVLDLLCKGKSYKVIADELFISPDTVRYHLKNIYKKLQVNSKYEAVIKVLKDGMT
jgi:DNA-binding NarL/FixJ family response regulator